MSRLLFSHVFILACSPCAIVSPESLQRLSCLLDAYQYDLARLHILITGRSAWDRAAASAPSKASSPLRAFPEGIASAKARGGGPSPQLQLSPTISSLSTVSCSDVRLPMHCALPSCTSSFRPLKLLYWFEQFYPRPSARYWTTGLQTDLR